VLHASPLCLQRLKRTMPSPNKFVQIIMSLYPLPKCIFPWPIADARLLGNIQHAQGDLMLLVSGKILALLGAGRRSRHHQEENLLFPVVLDEAGKYSKCGDLGAIANKSVRMTRASTATLDPYYSTWHQKDRYCAIGGCNHGPIGDALRNQICGTEEAGTLPILTWHHSKTHFSKLG
jgi:hypothetical protein